MMMQLLSKVLIHLRLQVEYMHDLWKRVLGICDISDTGTGRLVLNGMRSCIFLVHLQVQGSTILV